MSFTAEEVWGHMAGEREESVLFATSYTGFADIPADQPADQQWASIIAIRNEVAKQIEALRTAGGIGSALDANVDVYADHKLHTVLETLGDELRFVLITSGATLNKLAAAPQSAVVSDLDGLTIAVNAVSDEKCVRCWHRRPDVGEVAEHPELCVRCVTNIQGDGEQRDFA